MKKTEISTKRNSLIQADFSSGKGLLANMEVTYGPNLIRNGGSSGEDSFVDSNSDGLADKFIASSTGTFTNSIVTGNGFLGNAQRLAATSSGNLMLGLNISLPSNKRYRLSFKYRCSKGLQSPSGGYDFGTTPVNTGNAVRYQYEFNTTADKTDFYMYIPGASSSDWFEVSEWELREVFVKDNSGLGNDLSVYGSPVKGYLGSMPAYIGKLATNKLNAPSKFTYIVLVDSSGEGIVVSFGDYNSTQEYLSMYSTGNNIYMLGTIVASKKNKIQVITGTYDSATYTHNIFIDGVKIKSNWFNDINARIATKLFSIGSMWSGSELVSNFNKGISINVCIPKILSDTEIQSISQRLLLLANSCGVWKASDTNALGPNLVKNGSFDDPSAWAINNGWSIANGVAVKTTTAVYSPITQVILTTGKTFEVKLTVLSVTSGGLNIYLGTNLISTKTTAGTFTLRGTCTGSTTFYLEGTPDFVGSIDDVSVREVSEAYTPLTDTTFVGVHTIAGNTGDLSKPNAEATALPEIYSGANIFYDATNHLLYGPLPMNTVEPIVDAKADGNKVYTLSKAGLSEFSLDTYQRLSHKADAGNNIAVSAAGNKYVYVTDAKAIKLSLVSPSTGRTLTYTRKVSGGNYIHTYLKDGLQIEQKTTANLFENPRLMEFPFFVSGSEFKVDPCDYVIDEIMIDNKVYDNYQIRSWAKADVLKDNNVKSLIAGVIGFSNSNIFSIDEIVNNQSAYAPELISLAKANNNPEKEIFYESE